MKSLDRLGEVLNRRKARLLGNVMKRVMIESLDKVEKLEGKILAEPEAIREVLHVSTKKDHEKNTIYIDTGWDK